MTDQTSFQQRLKRLESKQEMMPSFAAPRSQNVEKQEGSFNYAKAIMIFAGVLGAGVIGLVVVTIQLTS